MTIQEFIKSSGMTHKQLSERFGTGIGIGWILPLRSVSRIAMAVPSVDVTVTATSCRGILALLV